MIFYDDSAQEASQYLRLALEHMGRHQIPVNPMNYTVWYEYVSGKNPKLTEVINDFLDNSRQFTEEGNHEIYRQCIIGEKKIIVDTVRKEVRGILAKLMKHILETGGDLSRFEKVLEEYGEQLLTGIDVDEVQRIVDQILLETKSIEESSELLQERLKETGKEVDALRSKIEQFKREATTDPLTGLANRRAFETALSREMEQAHQSAKSLGLLLMDIDHFKRINDNFGHLVGDNVLRMAAAELKKIVKGRDMVARYGGEEFVVILPDTPLKGAMIVAEQVRAFFEAKKIKRKDDGKSIGTITMSIGVAQYRPGESSSDFFQRADQAMYQAKQKGRNLICGEAST